MMKRLAWCLLSLFYCFSACAHAQDELHWLSPTIGGNDAVMVVDNGDDWRTRLNLRSEARKGSEIRGRIYTGTRVELYEDNGEWCTVGLNFEGGSVLTGCVMKQYLSPLDEEISALCPIAVAQGSVEVVDHVGAVAWLELGDTAYVMAACGERYFLMVPGVGQGYAPADAFEPLEEPREDLRIAYRTFAVPQGGVTFADEYTGEEVRLAGGVRLEDCWKTAKDTEWRVTFGAGIQRSPRVQGRIPQGDLTVDGSIPFEGVVYAYGKSFVACVGMIGEEMILRRTDKNGDIFWAQGEVPKEAVLIQNDRYEIRCEGNELLSQAVIENIFAYVTEHGVLDERTRQGSVTRALAGRCGLLAALELNPGTGELVRMRAWLEDADGSYVTGGDLDLKTGAIIRWGSNT